MKITPAKFSYDCHFFSILCILMRLEDAGIIGAGQETVHQRCALKVGGIDVGLGFCANLF